MIPVQRVNIALTKRRNVAQMTQQDVVKCAPISVLLIMNQYVVVMKIPTQTPALQQQPE